MPFWRNITKQKKTKHYLNVFKAESPFKGFDREFVWGIDDSVLINNITNRQELTPAKRKVRERGKEFFIEKKDGTKVNKIATGDSIRGQLHQETFYGAIKPAQKGEKGNLLKDENGKFIQEEEVKYVVRIPFQYKKDTNTPGFKTVDEIKKQVVDEGLKAQIEKQVNEAGGLKEAFEKGMYLLDKNGKPHGNKIRHIRVWASVSNPLAIKKQTYLSDKEYKQSYWAANATNSFFALYKSNNKKKFAYRNLFETAKIISANPVESPKDLFESEINVTKAKITTEFSLAYVLEAGIKVLFKQIQDEDLRALHNNELVKRLYVYTSYEDNNGSANLKFKYHLEARSDKDITETYKESEVDFINSKPTLRLAYSKYDFIVEGYDFEIKMDGTVEWKNKSYSD